MSETRDVQQRLGVCGWRQVCCLSQHSLAGAEKIKKSSFCFNGTRRVTCSRRKIFITGHPNNTRGSATRPSMCPKCRKEMTSSFPEQALFFLRRLFPQAVNGYEFEKNCAVGYLLNSECEHTIIFKTVSSLPRQTKKITAISGGSIKQHKKCFRETV